MYLDKKQYNLQLQCYVSLNFSLNKTFYKHFFNWDSLNATLNSHYETRSYKKKKYKKIEAYIRSVT